jgi:membrane-bound lytic murein transglycosylase B
MMIVRSGWAPGHAEHASANALRPDTKGSLVNRHVPDLSRRAALLAASGAAVALALPAWGASPDFDQWLLELRAEAAAKGVSEEILNAALEGLKPNPRIIELDRSQPEFTLTFQEYLDRVVPEARITAGKERLVTHKDLLQQVATKYGVQPRFIVALWGIESDFGQKAGGFNVIEALATLAHDGRRSNFFRKELLAALQILEERHVTPENMTGSWAGAMGQSQFMPTSFREYAVDFDGDGRRDIWQDEADIFASIANYLANFRWRGDQTWGRPVRLPKGFDMQLADGKVEKTIEGWRQLDVRRSDGGELPGRDLVASIVLPAGQNGPAFIVYPNYKAILYWNRSTYFATAVGLLADQLGGS